MNAKASASSTQTNQDGQSQGNKANAVALLKADHRKVNTLFRQAMAENSAEKKAQLVREICTELIVHTKLEEEIFYAACREANVEDEMLDEAQVEHDGAKILIAELLQEQPDAPFYDAKVSVLSEYIKHHVGEEENPGSGIFARARAAKLDMNALGQRLQSRKEELMQEIKDQGLSPPTLRALDVDPINRSKQENSTMPRQYERDRDDRGRFASEDDDRRGGRGYYGRSNERERDDQGRFMNEDADQRYSSRGSSRDGQRGWYGDSEGSRASDEGWESRGRGGDGYSSRSRDDEEDGYSRGSQGASRGGSQGSSRDSGRGWYGDPEGHSRASEEGWENRGRGGGGYSSRSRDEEDYGYSRSPQGSMRGGSQGSSRGSQETSRGSGRGWYGDPEGHSRASEEGWENRGRSGYSRSRDEDDDRDQRGSSGGRGHGGWFGDPRGHAEASRRGWQNR
jgi:hypothetical protein